MCSIAMPADYDVIVAHSPPVFSHSPPVFSHSPPSYYGYASCRSVSNPPSPLPSRRMAPSPQRRAPSSPKPRRPILVLKSEDSSGSDEGEPTSPTKLKKKVVFADDRGLSLTHVRMLTEGPGIPPKWNSQFLMLVTRGMSAEITPEPWEATFPQPAANYLEFRRRLDENNVSLENTIIRESEEAVTGTVKVRNLSFEKQVFVRSSIDSWSTQEDLYCTFITHTPAIQGVKILYDTFSFRLMLPPRSRMIEFCVCYRCEEGEYWDNNNGKNYRIFKKNTLTNNTCNKKSEPISIPNNNNQRFHDRGIDTWTDYSMFEHQSGVPYW